MVDSTWIRVYNGKRFLTPGGLAFDSGYTLGNMTFGSLVTNGDGGTGIAVLGSSTCSAWGVGGTNSALFVSNGDGNAQSCHVEGTTFQNNVWYAVTDRAFYGPIRINWMLIKWI